MGKERTISRDNAAARTYTSITSGGIASRRTVAKALGLGAFATGTFLAGCVGPGTPTDSSSRPSSGASPFTTPSPTPTPTPKPQTLPGGGRVVFPQRRFVALYGHPGTPSLGVLGEQDVDASVARVKDLAAQYQAFSKEPVIPAFEIIATVAAGQPGPDGNFSNEWPVGKLQPWVDAAGKAGVYVVLDLQSGRTDSLDQAKFYEPLLKLPHVGLALDPEWRLRPDDFPLQRIGAIWAEEVNRTSAWLATLTGKNDLPQKVFILHQFRSDMLPGRQDIAIRKELATIIHADGQGALGDKLATWRALQENLPKGAWLGWKNFYDEDPELLSPKRTMTEVKPTPWFVSYQ